MSDFISQFIDICKDRESQAFSYLKQGGFMKSEFFTMCNNIVNSQNNTITDLYNFYDKYLDMHELYCFGPYGYTNVDNLSIKPYISPYNSNTECKLTSIATITQRGKKKVLASRTSKARSYSDMLTSIVGLFGLDLYQQLYIHKRATSILSDYINKINMNDTYVDIIRTINHMGIFIEIMYNNKEFEYDQSIIDSFISMRKKAEKLNIDNNLAVKHNFIQELKSVLQKDIDNIVCNEMMIDDEKNLFIHWFNKNVFYDGSFLLLAYEQYLGTTAEFIQLDNPLVKQMISKLESYYNYIVNSILTNSKIKVSNRIITICAQATVNFIYLLCVTIRKLKVIDNNYENSSRLQYHILMQAIPLACNPYSCITPSQYNMLLYVLMPEDSVIKNIEYILSRPQDVELNGYTYI